MTTSEPNFCLKLVESIRECQNVKCWLYRKKNPQDPYLTGFKFGSDDEEEKIMKSGFLYSIDIPEENHRRIGLIQCFEGGDTSEDIHCHFYVDSDDLTYVKEVAENSLTALVSYIRGIRIGMEEGDENPDLPIARRKSRPRYSGMKFTLNKYEMAGISDVLERMGARIVEATNECDAMSVYRIALE